MGIWYRLTPIAALYRNRVVTDFAISANIVLLSKELL